MSRRNSQERSYTSARERAEKQSTGFTSACLKVPDGVTMFKPKAGTMLLDILPYEAGDGNPWAEAGNLHWERTYYVHRGIGANGDMVLCPRMSSKQRCPICEARLKLMKEGDEDNEALIKDLSPKQRQLFNVINLKDPDKGIQLWDISYFLFGKMLDSRLRNSEEEDDWDKFFFLENGLTLKVGFEEESFGGRTFCKTETIDFKQRKEDYEEDILKEVHPLDDIVIELEYDDLKKTFLEARDEDKDDDDAPKSKRSKRDAEEDEDGDKRNRKTFLKKPADEEEEEDETPRSKKKSAKSDKEDDWSDFDEDEDKPKRKSESKRAVDEEEEDEPLRRKKRDVEEDEDEPARKPKRDAEEDEEEAPRKKKKPADEEDDWADDQDEKPKRKSRDAEEEDEDEDKPKKKNRFARQEGDRGWDKPEDEDEDKPRRKKRREEDED